MILSWYRPAATGTSWLQLSIEWHQLVGGYQLLPALVPASSTAKLHRVFTYHIRNMYSSLARVLENIFGSMRGEGKGWGGDAAAEVQITRGING